MVPKKILGFTQVEVGRISTNIFYRGVFFHGFFYIQTVVGFGISEPSTVLSVTVSRYDLGFRMQFLEVDKENATRISLSATHQHAAGTADHSLQCRQGSESVRWEAA